ncbi:MAG: hypothetical protein JST08_08630 [Actinobacteria bacterium]|nr:hypothetical protein [Actinomycetota bacterium]
MRGGALAAGTRAAALLGCASALLLGAALAGAPGARAAIDPFGKPTGHDRAELRGRFLAAHPRGYAIVGYHASVYFHFRFAGVYYLERKHGAVVEGGVEIFRRRGSGWRPDPHPSATLALNLAPARYFYFATLTGSGSYLRLEESEIGEPELAATTRSEIQLTLAGSFGGRKGLRIVLGQEQPGGASSPRLLGGAGTSSHVDAADPGSDYSCAFRLDASSLPTSLALGWHGKEELTADLNLGDPVGSGGGECSGAPEDPGSHEPWIELRADLAHPPLGKPFDLPLGLEHQVSHPERDQSGVLIDRQERSLALTGDLRFSLATIEAPYFN